MAKNTKGKNGKSLVIVESPAKARTISKFLGKDYAVEASIGHVRDLPKGAKEIPKEYKEEEWAYLGVNVEDNFTPVYIIPTGKKKQVDKLKKLLKESKDLYLATDEDREGEAISWHLCELLKPKVPVHRLVFHEITKEAISAALDEPRGIDDGLVRAQETRRILDRLYGYEVSPLLWRKVRPKLSAGRVQSVAVRMIVQRERERMAFHSATYWDLLGQFSTAEGKQFQAELFSIDSQRIPVGKDFDPATGKLNKEGYVVIEEVTAREFAERLRSADFRVTSLEEQPYRSKPYAPFTTSTMQQEANRKLNFTAKRTMQVAQSLYENGRITYMRTDSINLAQVAVQSARDLVNTEYGNEYLPDQPRRYTSKVKNAQEAHEAIRPAGHPFELPETLRSELNFDEFRLFELIWKRTIASQMADARGRTVKIRLEADGAVFNASGRIIDFPGYFRAYVEGSDDPDAELADKETVLPKVAQGDILRCVELEPKDHTTQPPARFSEAALTRELERLGIGRPSTYASIIDTILQRKYVFKKGSALVPEWVAFSVTQLLERHLPTLIDYQFTAQMEDDLDAISRNEEKYLDYLNRFYFGNSRPGLKKQLEDKIEEIDARNVSQIAMGKPDSGPHQEDIYVRVGRYGPFLEQGERRASLPGETPPDELTVEVAIELLDRAAQPDEPLGACPETGKQVFLKEGRFGTYVQMGTTDSDEKPKNAGLLKGMMSEDVTLEVALKLLSLPRILGEHPESKEPVVAHNGRFGPYIKCGAETRSLPADQSPIDITQNEALVLLAQPKQNRRGRAAPREPLKTFESSPVTEKPIQLLDGRYGPYVTDGTTNASIPKGTSVESVDFKMAVDLLSERAAKGPAKKKTKKKTAKKKTAKKASKKTTKKGTVKRTVTKKKTAKSTVSVKKKSVRKKK